MTLEFCHMAESICGRSHKFNRATARNGSEHVSESGEKSEGGVL